MVYISRPFISRRAATLAMGRHRLHHHIVLFPFLAKGHIIPFLALANLIDQRYHNRSTVVTVVSTPLNAVNIRSSLPPNTRIHVRDLPFHAFPSGAESTDSIPDHDFGRLYSASLSLQPHFDRLISTIANQDGSPTVTVVADIFFGWTVAVARRHGAFHATMTTSGGYGTAPFTSASLRHSQSLFHSQISLSLTSDGLLCNSAEELEPTGLRLLRQNTGLLVWPVGPLLLDEKKSTTGQRAGKRTGVSVEACMEWLDSHPAASVLYVSFGSQNTVTAAQMKALAVGLEASGKAFLWVVRPPAGFNPKEDFRAEWLPPGFEERVRSRKQGMLVRNWAPQPEILSHRAVGGFLSHCGWNSTLESLASGVPMIGWPMGGEQFYNAKMLEEELGVCVEVERGVGDGVTAKEVERVVRLVVGGEKKGLEMRRRAAEAAEKIKWAMAKTEGKKGSSLKALDEFMVAATTRGVCVDELTESAHRIELQ